MIGKMLKTFALAIVIAMVNIVAVAATGGTWGGIDWTLTDEGVLTIAPTTGSPVPDKNAPTKRTYQVGDWRETVVYKSNGSASAIGGAPYDMKAVKTLIIKEGVTKIGSFTAQFPNCTGEVVIPSTVTYIGQEAFHKTPITKLKFAEGGNAPLCIANGAFKKILIEEVRFPSSRLEIHLHHWAFGGCSNLKTAYIPAGIAKAYGGEHVDYFDNFNSQSNSTWANYGSIFTGCTKIETIKFESAEARDVFFTGDTQSTNEDYIVASAGLTAYNSVQAAIDAADEGATITLIKDVKEGTTVTVAKTVSFGGKTFKGEVTIAEGANLVVKENGDKIEVVPAVATIGSNKYETLQEAINAVQNGETITLLQNCVENVIVTQKEGVSFTIDGAGKTFTGVLTVFGDGRQAGAESLTIAGINFVAANGASSCIVSPDRSNNNKYSYSHNVTVDNCTFSDPDGTVNCAAIRHEDGGDKNWTVKNCTVDATMHSLLQVNNVAGKLTVNNCTVNSKNGLNLNSCTNVEIVGCNIAVKGYAVRAGVASGGNPNEAKTFKFENNILSTDNSEGDAVVVLRASSANANLSMEKNAVEGSVHFSGVTANTGISADANFWGEGLKAPVIEGTAEVSVTTFYKDRDRTNLGYSDPVAVIGNKDFASLAAAVAAAGNGETVVLVKDCAENVTVTQKPDVKFTIDGAGKKMTGTITVDGKSATYLSAGVTIKNIAFDASGISSDASINLGVSGNNNTRYTCNVTVDNCTFTGANQKKVAIKSYTGGDKNLAITKCTVDNTMHSLLQAVGIAGITVDDCTVESKNGINLNSSSSVEIKNSTIEVSGYAVRAGVANGGDSGAIALVGNTLKTTGTEDAVIVLRDSASASVDLDMSKNIVIGATHISGVSADTDITADANFWGEGKNAPVVSGETVKVGSYYTEESLQNLWVKVSTYEELVAAFKTDNAKVIMLNNITAAATESSGYGKAGIVLNAGDILDGAGYTLKITGAGATWDCAIAMKGGEVRNLTIDGAMRGVFMPGANGDVVIDNCVFQNVVYTFNSDAGSKNYAVTIKNSTLNGWTSFSNVHKSVDFVNCSFGEGSGYAYCRPYQATTFTDCTFAEGYEFDTAQTAANALSFTNCTYAGKEISLKNSGDMFSSKGQVLVNGTSVNFSSAVAKIGSTYYTTIASAVSAAKAGDTVMVFEGEYNANIDLTKAITLEGQGRVVITGSVDLRANGACAKNLVIKNSKTGTYDCAIAVNAKNVKIEGCELIGYNGLRYCYTTGNVLLKNTKIVSSNYAVHFDGKEGANISFESCDITGCCSYASTVASVTYTDCKINSGSYDHRYFNKNASYTRCEFAENFKILLKQSGSNVAFNDCGITIDQAKAFFAGSEYYVVKGNVTVDGVVATFAVTAAAKYFDSLQEAIDSLATDKNYYVSLNADIVLTETVRIPAEKKLTLNLNGKTVTMIDNADAISSNRAMIHNEGNFTIEDDASGGKFSYTYTGANAGTTYAVNTITSDPGSTLTVKGGTIENLTWDSGVIAYAIDSRTNGGMGDVTLNIKGGKITSLRQAIRVFANSTTNIGTLNISGGEMTGRVIVQNSNANANKAVLNISGGTFKPNDYKSDVLYVGGSNSETIDIIASVTGGTFNGAITDTHVKGFITGGTFATDVTALCALGYIATPNNGMYIVADDPSTLYILNLAELKAFRDSVNSGNTYKGITVYLAADIDLGSEEWTPIGTSANSFKGIFDGNGKTISNLVINGGSTSDQGFFGRTDNGEVKNLTINNAKVSGRLNVGVVAGTPYTTKYTNIKVTGHVEVNGMAYVGGVGGKNAYANWTDITVDVDSTSYVKANSVENGNAYRTYVGGVIGFIGEGSHTFKNISSNIKVIGSTCDIGGLFGIAHYGNNFENVTFTGSVEAPADAEEVGGIAGVWHNQKGYAVTFTTVTSTGTVTIGETTTTGSVVGSAYNASNETPATSGSLIIDGKEMWLAIAKIGDVKYTTVQAALTAAQNGDTIVLLADVNEGVSVSGKKLTLDLNGKKIYCANSDAVAVSGGAEVTIKNGTLESNGNNCAGVWVKNASATLEGCTFVGTNANASSGVYASNGATVIINNCNLTANHYALVMMGATVTINSGTFEAPMSISANGSDDYDDATLTINGGTFKGGIYWPANGKLTINDGIFTADTAVYVKSGSLEIKGGTFTGNGEAKEYAYKDSGFEATGAALVIENVGANSYDAIGSISITGGTFISVNADAVESYSATEGVEAVKGFISGGTFSSDVTSLCETGYATQKNEDNMYEPVLAVVEIRTWDDLKALDARVEGGDLMEGWTVKLMNDIDLYEMGEDGEPVTFNPIGANTAYFKGTFDGQGHTIKNMYQSGWALGYDWYNYGTIGLFAYIWNATIKNVTIENAECFVEGGNVAGIAGCAWGNCTFENITIKNSKYATYNNRAAGIVGYTGGSGTMTYKDITVDGDTVIAGLWGSFDSSLGGVVGSIQDPTKHVFKNVNVACRLDAYNDVTAAYPYYAYRMCGMLIGRLPVDGNKQPILSNVEIGENVVVDYSSTPDYTYTNASGSWKRVEAGYAYDGVDMTQYPDAEVLFKPFNSIFGGQQYGSYGQDDHEDIEVKGRKAYFDGDYFASLENAIKAADGAKDDEGNAIPVELMADFTGDIVISKGLKLDLNGFTFNANVTTDAEGYVVVGDNGNYVLSLKPLNGEGTEAIPYLINNLADLVQFSRLVNAGNDFAGKFVKQTSDIDMTGVVWTPIGSSNYDKAPAAAKKFAGSFDGDNHTITGLSSVGYVPAAEDTGSTEYSFGLFGYVYGADIKNVKFANVNIECSTRTNSVGAEVYGSGNAALVGYYVPVNEKVSVIDNCHVLGGSISSSNNMGGLIGHFDSQAMQPAVDVTISNCSNAASVTAEAREAGGILGLINGTRKGNYFVVMRGSISFINCVNTGAVTTRAGGGSTCAGGILGRDNAASTGQRLKIIFDNCSNSGTITADARGETHVAGLGTSFYSHGAWVVVKDSENTGDIVVNNPNNETYAGGLVAYAGVVDLINSTTTGEYGYVGDVNHILFLEKIENCADDITGNTYHLNGGTSPEYAALVDDAAMGGNFHLVETAYRTHFEFAGWYDNPNFTGNAYTSLNKNVKVYYAKWTGNFVAVIGETPYESVDAALDAAYNAGMKDVVITIIGENTSATADTIDLYNKYRNGTAFNTITIRQSNTTKPYYFGTLYTGWTTGKVVFDGVNLVVTTQMLAIGKVEWINNSIIKRTNDVKNFVFYGDMYIEPGSKFESQIDGIGSGSSLTIDGGKTDGTFNSTVDYKTVYVTIDAGNTMTIKNGAYVLVTNYEISGDVTINGTLYMYGGRLEAKRINGSGTIAVDGASMNVGDVVNITANLSGFSGNVTVVNNDRLEANIVNNKIVLSEKCVAKIGDVKYVDFVTAVNAAQAGETVVLLADINLGDVTSAIIFKKSITIDGQNHKIIANSVNDSWNNAIFAPRGPISYTFKNVTVELGNAASNMAAFNMKYGGNLENVTVKGAFGQAVSVSMAYSVRIANSKFDGATWGVYANSSGAKLDITGTTFNTIGAVYLHQNGELTFSNNILAADCYIETDAAVDVSQNFWNGSEATGCAPSEGQLKGGNIICDSYYASNTNGVLGGLTDNVSETPVIKIDIDGVVYEYGPRKLALVNKLLNTETPATNVKITLLDNVALENGLQIGANIKTEGGEVVITSKTVEIDLNGKTLTGFVQINDNVIATVKNGTIDNTGSSKPAVDVIGVAVLESMTIRSANVFKVFESATLMVKTGTYGADPSEYLAVGSFIEVNADGTYSVRDGLAGEGTAESPYLIKNRTELEFFRDSVNAGETKYNAPGVWVALAADIDLAGTDDWTVGIGDGHNWSFDGNFDGKGHTIKNLTVKPYADGNKYLCGGLFGYIYGGVTIKNLVLENVTIDCGDKEGHNVGALVGFANNNGGKANISGITVKGIAITAPNAYGVGAIVGYSYRDMGTISNCSVIGNEGSFIKGYSFVGGITGYSYANATIEGCSVSNVAITATKYSVGGIAGIAGNNTTIAECSVLGGSVAGEANVGAILGAISGEGMVLILEDCGFDLELPAIGGNYIDNAPVTARIGYKYYTTVTKAITAAQNGDTVQLLPGTISEEIKPWAADSTHASEKSITIEGASDFGTTLTGGLYLGYDDSGCREHTITIKGIAFEGKGILVAGQKNVVIEGNKFTNITAPVATTQSATANAISVIGKNVIAVVKNNIIDGCASGGIHLRDVVDATVESNIVANVKNNTITINPTSGSQGAIVVANNTLSDWGKSGEGRAMRISGGATVSVNGNVMSNDAAPEEFVKITGAGAVDASANYWNGKSPMAAGIFLSNIAGDPAAVLSSYYRDAAKQNLAQIAASVAKVGDKYYATFAKAYEAANAGDEITLLTDLEFAEIVKIEKAITINLNGKSVTSSAKKTFEVYANATFKNGVIYGANRCIDTRKAVELTLTDMKLVADEYKSAFGNPQPLTIGGSENGTTVTMSNVEISARDGYAIITFVNTELKAEDCAFRGYNALYVKAGSDGSDFYFENSELSGSILSNDVAGNSFSTIAIRASDIGVYVDGSSIVKAAGNYCKAISFNSSYEAGASGAEVVIEGMIEGNILPVGDTVDSNVVIVKADYVDALADRGYAAVAVADAEGMVRVVMAVAKIGNVSYATLEVAFAAAQNGDEVKILKSGTYALTTSGKNITITGAVDGVVFDNIGAKNMDGANVTFNNVTFDYYPNMNYTGLQHSGNLVYNNCTFDGQVFLYGQSETFNNCVFNQNSADAYNVWTYSADPVAFNNCTFNCAGKSVLIYHENGSVENAVTVTGCSFVASQAVEGKAAIEMDSSLTAGITLTIDGSTTVAGFGKGNVSGNSLWNNKKGQYTDANNDITVVVNGVTVLAPVTFVAKVGDVKYTTVQAALTAAQNGDTIVLLADVNEGVSVSGKKLTLDLNGKKIYCANSDAVAVSGGAEVTIKNGTLESNGNNCAGVWVKNASATLEGCTFVGTNANASSGVYASNGATVIINNCNLTANHYALVMMGATVTINSGTFEAPMSISANGSDDYDDATLTINGGTFKGGIYWPANGKLTINDGIFTADTAVYVKSGSLEIKGGTFTGNGEAKEYAYKDSGFEATGAALVIENVGANSYDAIGSISITGGKFISENAAAIQSYSATEGVEAVKGFITGGTFSSDVTELCAFGLVAVLNDNEMYGIAEYELSGSGSKEDPFLIKDAYDLVFFRDSVNSGDTKYNAPGRWVALGADIDLAGTEWNEGIGDGHEYSFDGCFNGKGHTIKNLTVKPYADASGYICGGLFGYIYGDVTICDLVIENPTIDCGNTSGHNVGILAGFAYNSQNALIARVRVIGTICVDAPNVYGVGGIIGYSYGSFGKVKDCAVSGDNGSYIKGYSFVGGVSGYNYKDTTITGCSVSNIDIIATSYSAGGIAGIVLANVVIKDSTVDSSVEVSAQASAASVVGSIAANGIIVKNCTAAEPMVGGNYADNKPVEARVSSAYYATLASAIASIKEDGNKYVTLVANVNLAETLVIGKELFVDLNGKTISNADGVTITPLVRIVDGATVTVYDSKGNGSVTNMNSYAFILGAADGSSAGNLVINSGTFFAETSVASVTKGKLTVKGGKFSVKPYNGSYAYLLNCIDANYKDGTAKITITGGTFENWDPANNAAESMGTNFTAKDYYSWNDNSAYTVVKPSVWMVNGATSNKNIVNDIDSKVVGAVTISKNGDKYVANAACVFKVLAVDTVNPENSPYSLTDGNGNTLKLRTGVQVKAKYVDSLTNDTTKIFKLVIE